MTTLKTTRHARPTFETLEDRSVPAVITATYNSSLNKVYLDGNESASNISVTQSGLTLRVNDSANGFNWSRSFASSAELYAAKMQFTGGASADRLVVSTVASIDLTAWGYGGNDHLEGNGGVDLLVGGTGHDVLKGNGGGDQLLGEAGNDDLFGGSGTDLVYGGSDNDFLDAGSASGETVVGGDGYDFNAYVTAVNGAERDDIHQGGGPTCWLLASLSSVAMHCNLAERISYQGNGNYRVHLLTPTGVALYQTVNFLGERNNADPIFNPNQEGESWALIMQRAVLQQLGMSTTSPPGGNAVNALPLLTGRSADWFGTPNSGTGLMPNAEAEFILSSLESGRSVVAGTFDFDALVSDKLVTNHAYSVVSVTRSIVLSGLLPTFQYSVQVRNPWGFDGGTGTGNVNNGLVTLSWAEFALSIEGYAVG